MIGDLLDDASIAGIVLDARDRVLTALTDAQTAVAAAKTSAEAAAAAHTAVAALTTAIGVAYRWTGSGGTSLQLLLPGGGAYGPAVDLQGDDGPAGPAPTFVTGSVSVGSQPSLTVHPDPTVANRWIVDAVFVQGGKGDPGPKGDDGEDGKNGTGTVNHTGSPSPGDVAIFGVDGDHIGSGGKLGTAAIRNVGTAAGTVAAGDDSRITGAAPLASPAFTGSPTAPSPTSSDNSQRLATTAFVQAMVAALIGAAPAALDTLAEIASQLQNDESAASALTTTVAGKLAKAQNLADLASVSAARTNLGLVIGTTVQAWDADLDAIAALSTTTYGRALLTTASAAALTALINAFGGDSGSGGSKGLVPPPAAGDAASGKFLRADGAWAVLTAAAINIVLFGDGSDGNVTISSGTVTLTRDMYYANLTLSGTGQLNTAGYRVFVSNTLDISAASALALTVLGVAPGAGGVGTAGTAGSMAAGFTQSGSSATAGATGTQNAGASAVAPSTATAQYLGGGAGASGAGASSSGGSGGSATAAVLGIFVRVRNISTSTAYGNSVPVGGLPAPGGASGSGTSGNSATGGGGGGGGYGGGNLLVFAHTINRGASTAAGAISARGSDGGLGGVSSNYAGSGGGGGGGGGGFLELAYAVLTGSMATNALDASGGAGGAGGAAAATGGAAGAGAVGGSGGVILVGNAGSGTLTSTPGTAGSAGTGRTGGAGGACMANL